MRALKRIYITGDPKALTGTEETREKPAGRKKREVGTERVDQRRNPHPSKTRQKRTPQIARPTKKEKDKPNKI